jgi:2'-5' RNA ligase
MALLVLAYPSLSRRDYEWMQAIRADHDQLYFSVVDPHFTLVFPVSNVAEPEFLRHVERQASGVRSFPFVTRSAVVVKDTLSPYSYVFLVPDEGNSSVVKLHDRLYTDVLRPELRLDLPFMPHIGVATSLDPEACKRVADELNLSAVAIGVGGLPEAMPNQSLQLTGAAISVLRSLKVSQAAPAAELVRWADRAGLGQALRDRCLSLGPTV